jgi:hypothetical protein
MRRRPAIVLSVVLWLLGSALAVVPAAEIEVRCSDGRFVRGSVVEGSTNRAELALEIVTSGIKIRRTLLWEHVSSWRLVPDRPHEASRGAVSTTDRKMPPSVIEAARPERSPSRLFVKAVPASSSGKIDWDSLQVSLRGVDQHGSSVPLAGTLTIALWAQRRDTTRVVPHPFITDQNFGSRFNATSTNSYAYQHPFVAVPNPLSQVAIWTRCLHAEVGDQAKPNDQVLLLPLPRPFPDHELDIGALGEVTAELLMPGVGVLQAADSDVALSHQSLLRREQLDRNGTRFFPNERTSGNPQFVTPRHRFVWPGGVSGPERGILPIQP